MKSFKLTAWSYSAHKKMRSFCQPLIASSVVLSLGAADAAPVVHASEHNVVSKIEAPKDTVNVVTFKNKSSKISGGVMAPGGQIKSHLKARLITSKGLFLRAIKAAMKLLSPRLKMDLKTRLADCWSVKMARIRFSSSQTMRPIQSADF